MLRMPDMNPDDPGYYIDLIQRLIATRQYEWARDTLTGISATIDRTGIVTLKQREALDHIITGRLKHDLGH
jgi:hypothetical protein